MFYTKDFLVEWKALTSCLILHVLESITCTCIITERCSKAMRAMRRFSQVQITLPEILARISSKDGGSCVLQCKGIWVECWSTTLIDTPSIPNQHSIYTLVDTRLTIDQLLIKCQMSVDRVWIRTLVEYTSRCHLRVSIDNQLWMSLVHMIQDG